MRHLLALCLATVLALAPAMAGAVSDPGNPAVTRLWLDNGDFACSAFYLDAPAPPGHVWVGSVQHCTMATTIARDPWAPSAEVHWLNPNPWDGEGAVVGLAYDPRPAAARRNIKLADGFYRFQDVYLHGFHAGIETVSKGKIVGQAEGEEGWYVIQQLGTLQGPGSSGSPVFNVQGELVGFIWGGLPGTSLLLMTPGSETGVALDYALANPPEVPPVPLVEADEVLEGP